MNSVSKSKDHKLTCDNKYNNKFVEAPDSKNRNDVFHLYILYKKLTRFFHLLFIIIMTAFVYS